MTEPYAFERILGNLVMNAAKFAPAGTTIEVGWIAEDEETVRLWVRDEGPGVPEPDRERIFDRFYRVERSGPGAGLGLAVVKELVLLHGGRVWMDSASPGAEGVVEQAHRQPDNNGTLAPQPERCDLRRQAARDLDEHAGAIEHAVDHPTQPRAL